MDLFGFPALKNGINMNFFFPFLSRYARCTRSFSIGELSLSLSLTHTCAHTATQTDTGICIVNLLTHSHSWLSFAVDYWFIFFGTFFFFFLFVYCPFIDWLFNLAVPPAYYAHLAAFRARFYMEPETSDSGSMTSGAAAGRGMGGAGPRSTRPPGANAAVRPLPALKENVKRVMFYC